ncbi:exo-rhamnogalacturonan lyase family protein [Tautonia rosea]|uniref:exo-rhamnogalacturonan lyase family protein n=1 Tax=Tautonia rosea TaxID=2728037 RepID=UPI0014754586|nr:hypothetical protein [Tautonia rosea]
MNHPEGEDRGVDWPGCDQPASGVDLIIDVPRDSALPQPVTFGLPMPRGRLVDRSNLALFGPGGKSVATQAEGLARWSDGSLKWVLIDAVIGPSTPGKHSWRLESTSELRPDVALRVIDSADGFEINTGVARFTVDRRNGTCLAGVEIEGQEILEGPAEFVLTDVRMRQASPRIESVELEADGPVRATVRVRGRFEGRVTCVFDARLSFFAGTGLVKVDWTLHNPRRARHPGGLWDLGDPGSVLFRDCSLAMTIAGMDDPRIVWRTMPDEAVRSSDIADLEIYQDSSGGENWASTNHVNRNNQVPLTFRGFRNRHAGREEYGLRANPVLAIAGQRGTITAAIPEFWQQFPKALEVAGHSIHLRVFPVQCGDPFELQGGERKTHTLWLHFGPPSDPSTAPLDWTHFPARVRARPEWYAGTGAIPRLLPVGGNQECCLESFLKSAALDEQTGLIARREIIDEYGWRNYGEIFADHEQEHYQGPRPAISHYNNQYDMVLGAMLQDLRTGDPRWSEIFDPLARHVLDIDIYHTQKDRSAYNGGLFWFTDHYKDAKTSTHRTYSRHNCRSGDRSYGGGPSSNHLFTSGLLLYHYLTGDPAARDAVIELADWVVAMDDGRRNILGVIDDGPTGLASATGTTDYHGPGRGVGNSVNTLIDGWLASGRRAYLEVAEGFIRRCIHPHDEIEKHDLLNVEKRWSYPVFLSTLSRYLGHKAEAGEYDFMYAYARESLLTYTRWMLEHERPYFDRPEELEYPTEAWPAQDFRKANAMRMAAEHADEPLRTDLMRRALEISERSWADLLAFDDAHRSTARAIALVMVEGSLDAFYRNRGARRVDCPMGLVPDFGTPERFVPQKARVRNRLTTGSGLIRALISVLNPVRWHRLSTAHSH